MERKPKEYYQERNRRIVVERNNGKSWNALSREFGIAPQRISQIYNTQVGKDHVAKQQS